MGHRLQQLVVSGALTAEGLAQAIAAAHPQLTAIRERVWVTGFRRSSDGAVIVSLVSTSPSGGLVQVAGAAIPGDVPTWADVADPFLVTLGWRLVQAGCGVVLCEAHSITDTWAVLRLAPDAAGAHDDRSQNEEPEHGRETLRAGEWHEDPDAEAAGGRLISEAMGKSYGSLLEYALDTDDDEEDNGLAPFSDPLVLVWRGEKLPAPAPLGPIAEADAKADEAASSRRDRLRSALVVLLVAGVALLLPLYLYWSIFADPDSARAFPVFGAMISFFWLLFSLVSWRGPDGHLVPLQRRIVIFFGGQSAMAALAWLLR